MYVAAICCFMLCNIFLQFIILTGGFGASPYLKYALETRLDPVVRLIVTNSSE
jgi:hypothetical protein